MLHLPQELEPPANPRGSGWRETTAVEHSTVDAIEPDIAFRALAALLDSRTMTTKGGAITLSSTAQDTVLVETGSDSMALTQTLAAE